MLNQISIMGRLVKDPELRYANETPFCAIRIACDRDYKNANGEKEADFSKGKLAATTPIAKALIGHGKGEVVEAQVPAGVIRFEILDISF